jgi:hypothetical protein
MTPVIPPPRHLYLYSNGGNGNYATYPPLYTNSGAHTARPRWHRSTQDEAWPQHVAPADREAKRSMPITSLCYRESYSHQISRKTVAPEATFFIFLFSPFHLFTINVTRASLGNLWQNHPNYMAHMHLSLPLRPLTAAHESHITWIVCWVSSGNPNLPRSTEQDLITEALQY